MPMSLEQLAPDVYACLQEEKGLGTSNSGPGEPRRRARRRHVLGPAAHARHDRALRARLARAGAARRQHAPQRRPLLGQPALRRRRADRPSPLRRGIRPRAARDDADAPGPGRQREPGHARRSPQKLADWDFTGVALDTADDAHRRSPRPRPRRHRASSCVCVGPAHTARRRDRASAARTHRLHRRRALPPLHADRLGRHVRRLDRGARRDRRARPDGRRARARAALRRRGSARDARLSGVRARRVRRALRARAFRRSRRRSGSTSGRMPAGPSPSASSSRWSAPTASSAASRTTRRST